MEGRVEHRDDVTCCEIVSLPPGVLLLLKELQAVIVGEIEFAHKFLRNEGGLKSVFVFIEYVIRLI